MAINANTGLCHEGHASSTITLGSMATALFTVAACPLPAFKVMVVAAPAVPVALNVALPTPASAGGDCMAVANRLAVVVKTIAEAQLGLHGYFSALIEQRRRAPTG